MMFALEYSHPKVVLLLLPPFPNEKTVLQSINWKADERFRDHISDGGILTSFEGPFNVGPLWFIARRLAFLASDDTAKLIDLFLRGGEERRSTKSAAQFGTAFHAAMPDSDPTMWELLVSKGRGCQRCWGLPGHFWSFVRRLLNTSKCVKYDELEQY